MKEAPHINTAPLMRPPMASLRLVSSDMPPSSETAVEVGVALALSSAAEVSTAFSREDNELNNVGFGMNLVVAGSAVV